MKLGDYGSREHSMTALGRKPAAARRTSGIQAKENKTVEMNILAMSLKSSVSKGELLGEVAQVGCIK